MVGQQPTKYWTYEALRALRDDGRRYEIIEGTLYELPTPNMEHAEIIANVMQHALWPAVEPAGGRVYPARVAVFLLGANMVQPDITVLLPDQFCYREERGVEGPPALVVEVLSPNTARHDLVRKRALYARAGVPEYWIVSSEAMIVEVLTLEGGRYRTHARVAGDEPLSSVVLPGIAARAAAIFEY